MKMKEQYRLFIETVLVREAFRAAPRDRRGDPVPSRPAGRTGRRRSYPVGRCRRRTEMPVEKVMRSIIIERLGIILNATQPRGMRHSHAFHLSF